MVSQSELVKDITSRRMDWKIRVCCVRKWRVPGRSLEFVFCDREGTRIQASLGDARPVKSEKKAEINQKIQEGGVYMMINFSVIENKGKYRPTDHKFKLNFISTTLIAKLNDADFPKAIYHFKTIPEIQSGQFGENTPLFDFLGEVARTEARDPNNKRTQKFFDFIFKDLQKNEIECTLWDDYAEVVEEYVKKHETEHVILLMQMCRTKSYKGIYGVSNSYDVTRILLNDDSIPEILEYRKRLDGQEDSSTHVITHVSNSIEAPIQQELCSPRALILTIQNLLALKEIPEGKDIWITGNISTILSETDWSYLACRTCAKKLTRDGEKFWCEKDRKHEASPLPRFRVRVKVVDGSEEVTLLLWDQHIRDMIKKSAIELGAKIGMENDSNDSRKRKFLTMGSRCPEELQNLVGKVAIFKLKLREDNINGSDGTYSVARVSEDKKLISKYKVADHAVYAEDLVEPEILELITQESISDGADSTFPTSSACDESVVEVVSSGQLSSNKGKRIKVEDET